MRVVRLAAGEGEIESGRRQSAAAWRGRVLSSLDIQRLAKGSVIHADAAQWLTQVLDGRVHQHPIPRLDADRLQGSDYLLWRYLEHDRLLSLRFRESSPGSIRS